MVFFISNTICFLKSLGSFMSTKSPSFLGKDKGTKGNIVLNGKYCREMCDPDEGRGVKEDSMK